MAIKPYVDFYINLYGDNSSTSVAVDLKLPSSLEFNPDPAHAVFEPTLVVSATLLPTEVKDLAVSIGSVSLSGSTYHPTLGTLDLTFSGAFSGQVQVQGKLLF